jgi:acyl carrier protein
MDTAKKLRKYVLETFLFTNDDGALGNADSFLDKGIIDSTGILELVMFLETEFGIRVSDKELLPANLDSIDRLMQFLERKKAAA